MDLQTLYYIFIALGGLILLSSLFGLDDITGGEVDFDTDDGSASVFSIRTISIGLLSFGIGALIMLHNGHSLTLQMLAGTLTSAIIWTITYYIMKGLYNQQGSSSVTINDLIGKEGTITIGTSRNGTSQIKLDTILGPQDYTCKEIKERKLTISDNVRVTKNIGIILIVEKITN